MNLNPQQEIEAAQRLMPVLQREPLGAVLQALHALAVAEQLCDAVPSRAQASEDPTLAGLGRIVNADGGYRRIAEARVRLQAFLEGAEFEAPAGSGPFVVRAEGMQYVVLMFRGVPIVLAPVKTFSPRDIQALNAAAGGPVEDEEALQAAAQGLVDAAARAGLVLTVEQRPLQPLAMRNYETVVSVRAAR